MEARFSKITSIGRKLSKTVCELHLQMLGHFMLDRLKITERKNGSYHGK
jgi:hypothetical protein